MNENLWKNVIQHTSGRDYEKEAEYINSQFTNTASNVFMSMAEQDRNNSRYYSHKGQNLQNLETKERDLRDWQKTIGIQEDLPDIEPGEGYRRDLDGNWLHLQDNYDKGLAHMFQTNNRRTLLGRTTAAIHHDIKAATSRLDGLPDLGPSDSMRAIQEEWADVGTNSVFEAAQDIFYRSWGPGETKVMFSYSNPVVALTKIRDESWNQEKKDNAWEQLTTHGLYKDRMRMLGITKEDVDSTNNVDHLFYMINSRYEQQLTNEIISANENNNGWDKKLTYAWRFAADNFINDPDTAVELTIAAAVIAANVVGGPVAWGATAALAGVWANMLGRGVKTVKGSLTAMNTLRKMKDISLNSYKLLPTQQLGSLWIPTMIGMKKGQRLFPALKWAYKNPTPAGEFMLVSGSVGEGAIAGFGAYFTNTSSLIDMHDQIYGEGNHGVDWNVWDLVQYTGLGAVMGGALGTGIRHGMKQALKPASWFFNNALSKAKGLAGGIDLEKIAATRKEFLTDWALSEVGVPGFNRNALEADPFVAKALKDAEADGYDIATRLTELHLNRANRGLSDEDVRLLLLNDMAEYQNTIAAQIREAISDGRVADGDAARNAVDAKELLRMQIVAENKGRLDEGEAGEPGSIKRAGNPAQQNAANNLRSTTRKKNDVDKKIDELGDAPENRAARAKLEAERDELSRQQDVIRKELGDINETWLLDEITTHSSNRRTAKIDQMRRDVKQLTGENRHNSMTSRSVEILLGGEALRYAPKVAAKIRTRQYWSKKDLLDLINELETEWKSNKVEIGGDDILLWKIEQQEGDEWLKRVELEGSLSKEAARLANPTDFTLKNIDPMIKHTTEQEKLKEAYRIAEDEYLRDLGAKWSELRRDGRVTDRGDGTEAFQLDTDNAIVRDLEDGKFYLETVGHRVDDSADAVVTKEPTPVKPKKDEWAELQEDAFWSKGQKQLVSRILEMHSKGLVDDLKAIYGLRLLIDSHKTEDGLLTFNKWWADLMEGTPDNSPQRLASPEFAHRKILGNMRKMTEEGVEFDNVILETLKESELVQNNRSVFEDVFDYVKPEKAEAPPKVDPVDDPRRIKKSAGAAGLFPDYDIYLSLMRKVGYETEAQLKEDGMPSTKEEFLKDREEQIKEFVEWPVRPLVRQLLKEGKVPTSSNAFNKDAPIGVEWVSKETWERVSRNPEDPNNEKIIRDNIQFTKFEGEIPPLPGARTPEADAEPTVETPTKTRIVKSEKFDDPQQAEVLWNEKEFHVLMGDEARFDELGHDGRVWFREAELYWATKAGRNIDVEEIKSMLHRLEELRKNLNGGKRFSVDNLIRLVGKEHRGVVENLFKNLTDKGQKTVHVDDVWETLMMTMARVDPDYGSAFELRVLGELANLEGRNGLGFFNAVELNKVEFIDRMLEVNDTINASVKNTGFNPTNKTDFRNQVINGIAKALKDSEGFGMGVRRRLVAALDPDGSRGIMKGSYEQRASAILKAFEEIMLPEAREGLFYNNIHIFADGTEGVFKEGRPVGEGIINIFQGREGAPREVIPKGEREISYRGGKKTIQKELGQKTMDNFAAPQTSGRLMELVLNLREHVRKEHILGLDAEDGLIGKLSDEDRATILDWLKKIKDGEIIEEQIANYDRTMRLISHRVPYSPRQALKNLDQLIADAQHDMTKLTPGTIVSVHDGYTFMSGLLTGMPLDGKSFTPAPDGPLAGLGAGMPFMQARPGSYGDAWNRGYELVFSQESGFAKRCRDEFLALEKSKGIPESDLDRHVLKALLDGEVGKIRAVDSDTIAKDVAGEAQGFESLEFTSNWRKEWPAAAVTRVDNIQKSRAIIVEQTLKNNEIDANASGINITLVHKRINDYLRSGVDTTMFEKFNEWGETYLDDVYLRTQQFVHQRGKETNGFEGDPNGEWWWNAAFKTDIESKGQEVFDTIMPPQIIRDIMKLPTLTPMYNAGFGSLRDALNEFLHPDGKSYIGNKTTKLNDGSTVTLEEALGLKDPETNIDGKVSWLAKRILKGSREHNGSWVRQALNLPEANDMAAAMFGPMNSVKIRGKTTQLGKLTSSDILEVAKEYADAAGTTTPEGQEAMMSMVALLFRAKVLTEKAPGRYGYADELGKKRDLFEDTRKQLIPLIYAEDTAALAKAADTAAQNSLKIQAMNHMARTPLRMDAKNYNSLKEELGIEDEPWVVTRGGKPVEILRSDVRADYRMLLENPAFMNYGRSMEGRIFHALIGRSFDRVKDSGDHLFGGYNIDKDPLFDTRMTTEEVMAAVKDRVLLDVVLAASQHYAPPKLRGKEYVDPTLEETFLYAKNKSESSERRLKNIVAKLDDGPRLEAELNKLLDTDPENPRVVELQRQLDWRRTYRNIAWTPLLEKAMTDPSQQKAIKSDGTTYYPTFRSVDGPEGAMPEILHHGFDEMMGIPLFRKMINEQSPVVRLQRKLREAREQSTDLQGNRPIFPLEDRLSTHSKDLEGVEPLPLSENMYNGDIRTYNKLDQSVDETAVSLKYELDSFKEEMGLNNREIAVIGNAIFGRHLSDKDITKMAKDKGWRYLTLYAYKRRMDWTDGFGDAIDEHNPKSWEGNEMAGLLRLRALISRENNRFGMKGAQFADDALNRGFKSTSLGDKKAPTTVPLAETYEAAIRLMTPTELTNRRAGWHFPDQMEQGVIIYRGSGGDIGPKAQTGLQARLMQAQDSTLLLAGTGVWEDVIHAVYRIDNPNVKDIDTRHLHQWMMEQMYDAHTRDGFTRRLAKELIKDDPDSVIKEGLEVTVYIDPSSQINPDMVRALGLSELSEATGNFVWRDVSALTGQRLGKTVDTWINAFGEESGNFSYKGNVTVGLTFHDKVRALFAPDNDKIVDAIELAAIIGKDKIRLNENQATALGSQAGMQVSGRNIAELRTLAAMEAKALSKIFGGKRMRDEGLMVEETGVGNVRFAGDPKKGSTPFYFKWLHDEHKQGVDLDILDHAIAIKKTRNMLDEADKVFTKEILEGFSPEFIETIGRAKAYVSTPIQNLDSNTMVGIRMASLGLTAPHHYQALRPFDVDAATRNLSDDVDKDIVVEEALAKWNKERAEAVSIAKEITAIETRMRRRTPDAVKEDAHNYVARRFRDGEGVDEVELRSYLKKVWPNVTDEQIDAAVPSSHQRARMDREAAEPFSESDAAMIRQTVKEEGAKAAGAIGSEMAKLEGKAATVAELLDTIPLKDQARRPKSRGVNTHIDNQDNMKMTDSIERGMETGSSMDDMVRDFLTGNLGTWDSYKNGRFGNTFASEAEFIAIQKHLGEVRKAIQRSFDEGEEVTIIGEELQLHSPDMDMQGIADIIAYGQTSGKVRIYDLKVLNRKGDETIGEHLKAKYEGAKFQKGDAYHKQVSGYAALLKEMTGLDVEEVGLIPIDVTYRGKADLNTPESMLPEGFLAWTDIRNNPVYIHKFDDFSSFESTVTGKTIDYHTVRTERRVDSVYKGWERPAGKYGILYTTGENIPTLGLESIGGNAADSGLSFSTRAVYEIEQPNYLTRLEEPTAENKFMGHSEQVTVVRRVSPEEIDPKKFYIFDNRDDYAEGTIITAKDTKGVKDELIKKSREQKAVVDDARDFVHGTESDAGGKKTMEYFGKKKIFKEYGSKHERVSKVIDELTKPNEEGVTYLTKREADLFRQVLVAWEGFDSFHNVMFRVSDEADFSARFVGEYDPEAKAWKRSIELLRQARENEGLDLGFIDILTHEIGHVVQHKAELGPSSKDYEILTEAFKDKSNRGEIQEMLNLIYGDEFGKKMFDNIFGRKEGDDAVAVDEFFAQMFSFVMLSKTADHDIFKKGILEMTHGAEVDQLMRILADNAIPELQRISVIMEKIRDSETAIGSLVRHIERAYYYATPVTTPVRPSGASRVKTKRTLVDHIDENKEAIQRELSELSEAGDSSNLGVIAHRERLEAELERMERLEQGDANEKLIDDIIEEFKDEDGMIDLTAIEGMEDVKDAVMLRAIRERQFDYMDSAGNSALEETFGLLDVNFSAKTKRFISMLATPFSGRSHLEDNALDVMRFFAMLTDEQTLYTNASYGQREGIPSLQVLSVDHHGEWDALSEMFAYHIKGNKSRLQGNAKNVRELARGMVEYYNAPANVREGVLDKLNVNDRQFVRDSIDEFDKLMDEVIDNSVATGKIGEDVAKKLRDEGFAPIRFSEEFYAGGKTSAAMDFGAFLGQRIADSEFIEANTAKIAANVRGEALLPATKDIMNNNTSSLQKIWDSYSVETKSKISDKIGITVDSDGSNLANVFRGLIEHINRGAKKEEYFGGQELAAYHNAITNPEAVNMAALKALNIEKNKAKHTMDPNSKHRYTERDLTKEKVSGAELMFIDMAQQMGTGAYMFTGNRFITPKDIWTTPELRQHVEDNFYIIAQGIQKGIGWDAYATRFIQKFFGVKGMGFKQAVATLRKHIGNKSVIPVTKQDGSIELRRFNPEEQKKMSKALDLLLMRERAAGRNLGGPEEDIGMFKLFVQFADFAITMVNMPNFLPASLLVELPTGFMRRVGRMFSNSADKVMAGYASSLSPMKRMQMMHRYGIMAQNMRGRNNRLMGREDAGFGEAIDEMMSQKLPRTKSGMRKFLEEIALFGFEPAQLSMKAAEILPAQQRLVGDMQKLYTLRRLIKDVDRSTLDAKGWRKLVRDSKMGSRYEHADEYQKLGLLEDGVLEQLEVWIRDTPSKEGVFDLDAWKDDIRHASNETEYMIKSKAYRAVKNHVWNAATKTNLDQRISDKYVGVRSEAENLYAKLVSYPAMWYRMSRRLWHTGTIASLAGIYLSYLLGETLYTKMLDIARGRDPQEIMEEWRKDPLGSFFSGLSRLPSLGYTSFLAGAVVDRARSFVGRKFGDNGVFGYSDAPTFPLSVGMAGGLTSVNSMLNSIGDIFNIIADFATGEDPKMSQYMRAAKVIPVPFRPMVLAGVGLWNTNEEIRSTYPSYGTQNDITRQNLWGGFDTEVNEKSLKRARERYKESEIQRKKGESEKLAYANEQSRIQKLEQLRKEEIQKQFEEPDVETSPGPDLDPGVIEMPDTPQLKPKE